MPRRPAGADRRSAWTVKAAGATTTSPVPPRTVQPGATRVSTAVPDFSRLKPKGGKRSSKREQIVNVFLRQEGHLSADDLVDIIRRDDRRVSRATVYRTLQWMVDAGIARKVDFGEGRSRFEHS